MASPGQLTGKQLTQLPKRVQVVEKELNSL